MQIDLHHRFAVRLARVLYVERDGERRIGNFYRVIGIFERGVREPVAEGICHRLGVVVIAGVALAEHGVFIPRFIILIADVDAFLIDEVLLAAEGIIVIGVVEIAEVDHGGGGKIVVHIGIDQLARRVIGAVEHAGDGAQPLLAARAYPHDGHVPLHQGADFHRVEGVEEHRHLAAAERFHRQIDEGELVVGKFQHVLCGIFRGRDGDVRVLRAQPADDHDGGVAVSRGVGDAARHGLAHGVGSPRVLALALRVILPHGRVDLIASLFKHLFQGGRLRGIDRARAAARDQERLFGNAGTQKRYFAALCHGQALVLQQHAAFRLHTRGIVHFRRIQLALRGVIAGVVVGIDLVGVFHLDLLHGLLLERCGDEVGIGAGKQIADDENGEHDALQENPVPAEYFSCDPSGFHCLCLLTYRPATKPHSGLQIH